MEGLRTHVYYLSYRGKVTAGVCREGIATFEYKQEARYDKLLLSRHHSTPTKITYVNNYHINTNPISTESQLIKTLWTVYGENYGAPLFMHQSHSCMSY